MMGGRILAFTVSLKITAISNKSTPLSKKENGKGLATYTDAIKEKFCFSKSVTKYKVKLKAI